MYVIRSGIAEVLVEDQAGGQHQVLRVEAGHTIGEMSLFRGGRSSGTVRAVTDLHVWMLAVEDFEAAAEQPPEPVPDARRHDRRPARRAQPAAHRRDADPRVDPA